MLRNGNSSREARLDEWSSVTAKRLALTFLILTACGPTNSDPLRDLDGAREISRDMDSPVGVLIPEVRTYDDELQIRVTLPRAYISRGEPSEFGRAPTFKPINYRTLEPVDYNDTSPTIVSYFVQPYYFREDSGVMLRHESFYDTGQMRFGLSYRTVPAPGRPEELLKRLYVKPHVSGEEFAITCTPPIGPGSIIAPTSCLMDMVLVSREMNGRKVGASVRVGLPASRVEDWRLIEAAIVTLLEPHIEWVEGEKQ